MSLEQLFGLRRKVAVITGGTGVLGSAMARGLAGAGARVGILGRRFERASDVAAQIERSASDGEPLISSSTSLAATCHKPRSPMADRSSTCRWRRGGRSLT